MVKSSTKDFRIGDIWSYDSTCVVRESLSRLIPDGNVNFYDSGFTFPKKKENLSLLIYHVKYNADDYHRCSESVLA